MHAAVGDRLVTRSRHVGERERVAEIIEVRGADGTPPFLVRWTDNDQEALVFPGPDATVEHPGEA